MEKGGFLLTRSWGRLPPTSSITVLLIESLFSWIFLIQPHHLYYSICVWLMLGTSMCWYQVVSRVWKIAKVPAVTHTAWPLELHPTTTTKKKVRCEEQFKNDQIWEFIIHEEFWSNRRIIGSHFKCFIFSHSKAIILVGFGKLGCVCALYVFTQTPALWRVCGLCSLTLSSRCTAEEHKGWRVLKMALPEPQKTLGPWS